MLEALNEYSESEVGRFVRAMGDFARFGVVPEFDDRGLRGLWRVVQPNLSRDDARYHERCRKNRYNSYLSSVKRRYEKEFPGKGDPVEGRDYLSYDNWIAQIDEPAGNDRLQSAAIACQHNGNENSNRNENGNDSKTQYNENLNGNRNGKEKGSENGKGEPGETPVSVFGLIDRWRQAVQAREMKTAYELSSQLSRMGYTTDPLTLSCRERDPS